MNTHMPKIFLVLILLFPAAGAVFLVHQRKSKLWAMDTDWRRAGQFKSTAGKAGSQKKLSVLSFPTWQNLKIIPLPKPWP